jgi:uncharacterized protein YodC (DUF2158 family)
MISQFKTGDRVKLKTSHQRMTVNGIARNCSFPGIALINDRYECVWHDGIKQQRAIFHTDELEWFVPRYDIFSLKNCWSL